MVTILSRVSQKTSMHKILIKLSIAAVVGASCICQSAHATVANADAEQAVRSVLTEVASMADSRNCDPTYIKAEVSDITSTIQRGQNLEAFFKVDRNAALLAKCGPQRHWTLTSTAEFVAAQLVVAVQLQSRFAEQERNLYVVKRNSQWATVLIEYARTSADDRAAAEEDWRILEQSRKELSLTGQLP